MAILLLTADLMTASRAGGAARRVDVVLRTAATAKDTIAACADDKPRLVLVDLTTPSLDVATLVADLKTLDPPPKILAFGPHVHEAALAAARAAGCDQVTSRGQFFTRLDELLTQRN